MTHTTTSVFDLPPTHACKAEPARIADDERHFARITACLGRQLDELSARLDIERRAPGGRGQQALDRDLRIHHLTARLRTLRRFSADACLGRVVPADGGAPVYIGRFGLTDGDGDRLLLDWRTPAAEPYFAATTASPLGLASRRRYRWAGRRIRDYWDEALAPDAPTDALALDEESTFIASLGAERTGRMRDVLGTIQADQDAIIRADSRGALVVDGGPGTGKTVVALHRAAYLLHADPRLGPGRGGVLFVGPNPAYLAYVADVLPSLGEDGVVTCTLRELVAEGAEAGDEADADVARLKASARMIDAIEPAVRLYEEPPAHALEVETPWADLWIGPDDWAEAFASPEPGMPHNEARDQVWETLVEILADRLDAEDVPNGQLRRALARHAPLARTFTRAWPLVEASVLVADLWSVPAYLRRCAPWLAPDEVRALQRTDASGWTTADLPLLDAARRRLGDPRASRRRREREATLAAEREAMSQTIERLVAAGDDILSWLDGDDLRNSLVDDAVLPADDPDRLAGPFAHVIVDEAQELTDAEWRMLIARCPSRSITVVGDRAQARHGFAESWEERLRRVGLTGIEVASLRINYRTPAEIMDAAAPVIRAAIPDANVPTSVRRAGAPVRRAVRAGLAAVLAAWLRAHEEGIACVIGDASFDAAELGGAAGRVQSLSPVEAKGLEFDLVALVDPDALGDGIEGAVDRYVAMTRATQELVMVSG